jgi:mannose-6-phosphate isomerase-like protein (cupin superfamily)
MVLIEGAGAFTAPGSAPNHYVEQLRLDDQSPHAEDEVYVVSSGRGRLVTDDGSVAVEPGSVIYVPAGQAHRFTDIEEDLAIVVLFAPPYGSRRTGEAQRA